MSICEMCRNDCSRDNVLICKDARPIPSLGGIMDALLEICPNGTVDIMGERIVVDTGYHYIGGRVTKASNECGDEYSDE